MTTCLQQQTEWISDAIRHLREQGKSVIEPTKEGEDAWVAHHEEIAGATLVPKTTSWYLGSNVPGKPRRLLSYIGGVGTYRQKCDEEAAAGYPTFSGPMSPFLLAHPPRRTRVPGPARQQTGDRS